MSQNNSIENVEVEVVAEEVALSVPADVRKEASSFLPVVTKSPQGRYVSTLSAATVRAQLKERGLSGKELRIATNRVLKGQATVAGAEFISKIAAGAVLARRQERELKGGIMATTYTLHEGGVDREDELAATLARVQELIKKMGTPEGLTSEEQAELAKLANVKH